MSFTRVNLSGWASNAKLTSAEQNQLDIDHANAVDKTGDSITAGTIAISSSGVISSNVAGGIRTATQYGIKSNLAEGISIEVTDGLVLQGSNNYPKLAPQRSLIRTIHPALVGAPTGWVNAGALVTGPATSTIGLFTFEPHHGATITNLELIFAVGSAHAGVPAFMPSLDIFRGTDLSTVGVAIGGTSSLHSASGTLPTPASGAIWYASGNKQSFSLSCDQNNVVDRTKYRYAITIADENGANAIAGNFYLGFRITYAAISNMAFP